MGHIIIKEGQTYKLIDLISKGPNGDSYHNDYVIVLDVNEDFIRLKWGDGPATKGQFSAHSFLSYFKETNLNKLAKLYYFKGEPFGG